MTLQMKYDRTNLVQEEDLFGVGCVYGKYFILADRHARGHLLINKPHKIKIEVFGRLRLYEYLFW